MKIISEASLSNFKAWAGAIDTQDKILAANKGEEFEQYIEENYPNGLTDTELNDFLWFEEEYIYDFLGIVDDEEETDEEESEQEEN